MKVMICHSWWPRNRIETGATDTVQSTIEYPAVLSDDRRFDTVVFG